MWKKRENYQKVDVEEHPVIKCLLNQRKEISDVKLFLEKNPKSVLDPFDLHGVEKGANIFLENLKEKGDVFVVGDYDADGIVSATMIKELCNNFKLKCKVFLPSRLEHGYGLNEKTIKAIKASTEPTNLLMVLDCGSNNFDEIEELKKYGFKNIIIIDHHIIGEKISDNADVIISWHLSEEKVKEEMCSTGEIFQFIRGIKKLGGKVNPMEFLTYAAIGTISDVSPVIGSNRIIVEQGLKSSSLDHIVSSGLSVLMNKSGVNKDNMVADDIGFKLAPRINAVGRLDNPDVVVSLLTEHEPHFCEKIADHVVKFNDDRKLVQKNIEKRIDYHIEEGNFPHGILVCDPEWHIGVVGIVASRVVEKYGKPALVIGGHKDLLKGSGRSIEGVNLKEILDSCPELFDAYGGHAAAVGVTLSNNMLDKANDVFNNACKKYFSQHEISSEQVKHYDACIKPEVIGEELALLLKKKMAPYCKTNNPEPIFKLSDVKICNVKTKVGDSWSLFCCNVEKNGVYVPYEFKTWNKFGDEYEGLNANIYFKFPQSWGNGRFDEFHLKIEDIILK